MTNWIYKWKKNNFHKVTNKDLFQRLDKIINACISKPIFVSKLILLYKYSVSNFLQNHVSAHSGIYGNEQADNLAKSGAMKQYIT